MKIILFRFSFLLLFLLAFALPANAQRDIQKEQEVARLTLLQGDTFLTDHNYYRAREKYGLVLGYLLDNHDTTTIDRHVVYMKMIACDSHLTCGQLQSMISDEQYDGCNWAYCDLINYSVVRNALIANDLDIACQYMWGNCYDAQTPEEKTAHIKKFLSDFVFYRKLATVGM